MIKKSATTAVFIIVAFYAEGLQVTNPLADAIMDRITYDERSLNLTSDVGFYLYK